MKRRIGRWGGLLGGVALMVGCGAGTQVGDSGAQGGDSAAEGGDSDDSDRLWRESSTELMIESRSSADGAFGGSSSSSKYSCAYYPRSQMSDEQLTYLRTLQPVETTLPWMCDASRTTEITVVDANSSWTSFKTDNSTAACQQHEVTLTLPATVSDHFSGGGLSCIPCDASGSCANGVCAKGVCVN
jgi:hypothetical protein